MHAYRMLIDGEWVEARSGRTLEVMNPATGEPMATVDETGLIHCKELGETAPRI